VARSKMLVTMDENRPLFSNARADPICAFDCFRPDSSDPNTPAFELFCLRLITAVVNRYSIGIAQQNDISLLADDRIKTIDFFLGIHNCFAERFAKNPEFAVGYDMRSCPAIWTDKEFSRASSPGGRHFFETGRRPCTLNNGFDLVEMLRFSGSMDCAEFACRIHVGFPTRCGIRSL
jgi:hypothetical protein